MADENPVIVNIKTRRSVREYLDMPLSEKTIKISLMQAGTHPPGLIFSHGASWSCRIRR